MLSRVMVGVYTLAAAAGLAAGGLVRILPAAGLLVVSVVRLSRRPQPVAVRDGHAASGWSWRRWADRLPWRPALPLHGNVRRVSGPTH